jgi:hypothetical protein
MKTPSKQELLAQIAILEEKLKRAHENDENLRQEISYTLDAPLVRKSEYGNETKRMLYSWFDIFRELGKLIVHENFARYVNDVSEMRISIEGLRYDLNSHIDQQRMDLENKRHFNP